MKLYIILPELQITKSAIVLDSTLLYRNFNTIGYLKHFTFKAKGKSPLSAWQNNLAWLSLAQSTFAEELQFKYYWTMRRVSQHFPVPSVLRTPGHYYPPDFVGTKAFHDACKAHLLRSNYIYYSRYKWDVDLNQPLMSLTDANSNTIS